MEDSRIIELYNSRNETAISESDKKYGAYCLKIAMNVLSDRGESEESVNDTWLVAWNRIPPAVPENLRLFFGKITRNISLSRYQKRRSLKRGGGEIELALDELEDCVSHPGSVEDEVITKETISLINKYLGSLSEKQRNIFLARYYFVYTIREIADASGKSEEYIRLVLSRTRKKLKKRLEEGGWYDL